MRAIIAFCGLLALPLGAARAEEATPPGAAAPQGHTIEASSGMFKFGANGPSVGVGLECRFLPESRGPLHLGRLPLIPAAGLMTTSKRAVYAYLGTRTDLRVAERWSLAPGLAVGAYEHGEDRRLGGTLEFRSGLELARSFRNGAKAGLAFQHMSNGRLYRSNPGANSLTLIAGF